MAFLSGNGSLNIRSSELHKLVFLGQTAQATLDDSEVIYLDHLANHEVNGSGTHNFDCILTRNGSGPYRSKVNLVKISENYFLGSIEFRWK